MLFRDSNDGDLVAITEIYAHYVCHTTASFETEPPDAAEMAVRRARILGARLPWLVAEIAVVHRGSRPCARNGFVVALRW